jgi:hypothetical protein
MYKKEEREEGECQEGRARQTAGRLFQAFDRPQRAPGYFQ